MSAMAKDDSEAAVEKHLCTKVIALGGMCMKFVSPGMRGVADRIVVLPANRIFFIELKKQTGTIRQHQWIWSTEMLKRGALTEFLKSKKEVDDFIARVTK